MRRILLAALLALVPGLASAAGWYNIACTGASSFPTDIDAYVHDSTHVSIINRAATSVTNADWAMSFAAGACTATNYNGPSPVTGNFVHQRALGGSPTRQFVAGGGDEAVGSNWMAYRPVPYSGGDSWTFGTDNKQNDGNYRSVVGHITPKVAGPQLYTAPYLYNSCYYLDIGAAADRIQVYGWDATLTAGEGPAAYNLVSELCADEGTGDRVSGDWVFCSCVGASSGKTYVQSTPGASVILTNATLATCTAASSGTNLMRPPLVSPAESLGFTTTYNGTSTYVCGFTRGLTKLVDATLTSVDVRPGAILNGVPYWWRTDGVAYCGDATVPTTVADCSGSAYDIPSGILNGATVRTVLGGVSVAGSAVPTSIIALLSDGHIAVYDTVATTIRGGSSRGGGFLPW